MFGLGVLTYSRGKGAVGRFILCGKDGASSARTLGLETLPVRVMYCFAELLADMDVLESIRLFNVESRLKAPRPVMALGQWFTLAGV